MAAKVVNVIGCGQVARLLLRLWVDAGCCQVGQVLNRSNTSSRDAVEFIGSGIPVSSWAQLDACDVWIIGTQDDAILPCANCLADTGLANESVAFHLSGLLSSAAISDAFRQANQSVHAASLHLLQSVPDADAALATFGKENCVLEGDVTAVQLISSWLEILDWQVLTINADNKALYHAACVLSSNYVNALLGAGITLMESAGFTQTQANDLLTQLALRSIGNIQEKGAEQALTGPIVRGDVATVNKHVALLPPTTQKLYVELGKATVDQALRSGRLPAESAKEILEVLGAVSPKG